MCRYFQSSGFFRSHSPVVSLIHSEVFSPSHMLLGSLFTLFFPLMSITMCKYLRVRNICHYVVILTDFSVPYKEEDNACNHSQCEQNSNHSTDDTALSAWCSTVWARNTFKGKTNTKLTNGTTSTNYSIKYKL